MASREELIQSINSLEKVDEAFFLKVYGYEISYPGFADEAIKVLNDAGYDRAREYYNNAVSKYERKQDEELKEVAHWYRQECEKQWQKRQGEGEEQRKQKIQSRSQKWKELSQILGFQSTKKEK